MRISSKGRYALAAVVEIARSSKNGENVAVVSIAQSLGISKIYLEQIFTQLKKGQLLLSMKGSRGGYQLARPPQRISAWDVLVTVEAALVESAEDVAAKDAPEIEMALKSLVFQPLDSTVKKCLSSVSLQALVDSSEKQRFEQAFMLNM